MKISKNIIANMRIIEYIKLFNYLKDVEELEGMDVIRTIYRLRKVSKELLNGVDLILQGKEPDITINGVSYQELVEQDEMRPIRAILMLDWIRREPEAAFSYMAEDSRKAPIQPLNDEEKDELQKAIERLKGQVSEVPKSVDDFEDSKDDIVYKASGEEPVENTSVIEEEKVQDHQ